MLRSSQVPPSPIPLANMYPRTTACRSISPYSLTGLRPEGPLDHASSSLGKAEVEAEEGAYYESMVGSSCHHETQTSVGPMAAPHWSSPMTVRR
jgi:hypothetical protein